MCTVSACPTSRKRSMGTAALCWDVHTLVSRLPNKAGGRKEGLEICAPDVVVVVVGHGGWRWWYGILERGVNL
jgi:hypothetical protein